MTSIRFTVITFTPTTTIISNHIDTISSPYLRIEIFPTPNGKDINNIKVSYYNQNTTPSRINEEISEIDVFQRLSAHIKGDGYTFIDKVASYINKIPDEEITIISKEYERYINNGAVIDGFISGIGAYLAFLLLNENGAFMNQFPFQFGALYTVRSGMTLTRNMFDYLSLVLTSLTRTTNEITLQLVTFIQTFINLWEPMFLDGPHINPSHQARLAIEVISGYSNNITIQIEKLNNVERRLQEYVDNALTKVKREINNLTIEARDAVKELNINLPTRIVDETVRDRIENMVKVQLNHIISKELGKNVYVQGLEEIKDPQNIDTNQYYDTQPQTNCTKDISDNEQHNHAGRFSTGTHIRNDTERNVIIATREEEKITGQIRIQNGQFVSQRGRNHNEQSSPEVTPAAFT